MSPHYKIHRIYKKKLAGNTAPVSCSLDAILKYDSLESQYFVYSELVASLLAQTIHVPVAIGVLTKIDAGDAYASIELGSPGLRLPDLLKTQYKRAATQYPDEAAALVMFDIFIGNWDRGGNMKATFVTPHTRMFQGFDHEHALLSVESDPMESIRRLSETDLIVKDHPFYGLLLFLQITKWAHRILETEDAMIHESCEFGRPIGTVTIDMQEALADALCTRKGNLLRLLTGNSSQIALSI